EGYQSELEGLQAQDAQLQAQTNEKRGRLNLLGPWEVRQAQLQRERDLAEKSYLNLVSKREDLQIRENARRNTARIIERTTTPWGPVGPNRTRNIFMSLI